MDIDSDTNGKEKNEGMVASTSDHGDEWQRVQQEVKGVLDMMEGVLRGRTPASSTLGHLQACYDLVKNIANRTCPEADGALVPLAVELYNKSRSVAIDASVSTQFLDVFK